MVTAVVFIIILAAFTGVGIYSATRREETPNDYLLAGRTVSPWLTALSGVATNNSGFMFLGLVASAYLDGIRSIWLMIGWIGGDWVAWFVVHRRLREQSEAREVNTIPGFIADGLRGKRAIAAVAGLIVLVFLGLYAAAQLKAGSKALQHVFGWDLNVGAIIGAFIVAAYCFAGGLRASIWTDAVQSMVMILAIWLLFLVALLELGGPGSMWSTLDGINPALTEVFPSDYRFGFFGFMLGWVGAGAGVVGQPHIMVRAMAIDDPGNMAKARRIYVSWYVIFAAACIGVGLTARALFPELPALILPADQGGDAELAMPILSQSLLPSAIVGIMLAGIFAATISTADSQILSCSAAITQDLAPGLGQTYGGVKGATLMVALIALGFALFGGDSVFGLVTLAWSTLAAGLGPMLTIRALGLPANAGIALSTMVAGVGAALYWRLVLEYSGAMYEVLPGLVAGFAVYAVLRALLPTLGYPLEDGNPERA